MFIGMVFLIFFPLIALLSKAVLYCCNNCFSRFVDRIIKRVFWNSYIRFWMEAYLELSISSLLRLKIFSFDSPSDSFHSVFSVFICILLAVVFFLSIAILIFHFDKLSLPESKQKFGDLYLGLNTSRRILIIMPVMFMLRRVLYAAVLVFWVDRSYF